MDKRGQVAVFVIIGIVLIIVLVLLFVFRDAFVESVKGQVDTEKYLNNQLKDIQEDVIEECVVGETLDGIKLYLSNGGMFSEPLDYLLYRGRKHRILCQNIPNDERCLSTPLNVKKSEEDLNNYLKEKINNCFDFSEFENKNYELIYPDELELDLKINKDSVVVNANYQVELIKDEFSTKGKEVVKTFDVSLGDLFKAVNNVLEFRSVNGFFDPVSFGILSKSKYVAEVRNPYPDEVYNVYVFGYEDYNIKFAITSEGRYDRLEGTR